MREVGWLDKLYSCNFLRINTLSLRKVTHRAKNGCHSAYSPSESHVKDIRRRVAEVTDVIVQKAMNLESDLAFEETAKAISTEYTNELREINEASEREIQRAKKEQKPN